MLVLDRAIPLVLGLAVLGTIACQDNTEDSPQPKRADAAERRDPSDDAVGEASSGEPDPEPAAPSDESEPVDTSEVGDETGAPAEDTGEAAIVQPPPDYGVFTFADAAPSDEELTLHGLAGYEIVAVHSQPDAESTKLGFLRIGTRLRVGAKISKPDCPKGWHELEGGGYACASKGLVVDQRSPYMSYQPAQARVDQPFPYDWAYVRRWNAPMWWRAPTPEELAAAEEQRLILEAQRTGTPLPGETPAGGTDGGAADDGAAGGEGGELPSVDDGGAAPPDPPPADPPPADPPPADPPPADPPPADTGEPVEEEPPIKLPLNPGSPWLEKGFFISVGEELQEGGHNYWRTARGGLVSKADAYPYTPKDYSGNEITAEMSFPVGFVMAKDGTKLYELDANNKLKVAKSVDKRTFLDLEEEVEHLGKEYMRTVDGLLVKKDVMRMPDLQPMPKGLEPWDRWIDVDLGKQMLVAYEGTRPVYVTLISSGKKGKPEEPFETPTGRYRIYSKQITSNMDGATATDGNYAIQDVPWVMYFQGSYALHGAFWHESFGYVRSHGCVNLGPTDARWMFMWSTPFLPAGWHGVHASDDNPGTTVVIRDSSKTK